MTEENLNNLNNIQKDILKELGNIGAGNAATAFASFLDRKIGMNVPSVKILPITEVSDIIANSEKKVAGVLLRVNGEFSGKILFILTEISLKYLFKIIFNKNIDLKNFGEVERSAITEVGNILSGAYLSAINKMTDFNLTQTVPAFSYDMVGAILTSALISLENNSDYTLLIETKFKDSINDLESYFFLIPEQGNLKKIFKAVKINGYK